MGVPLPWAGEPAVTGIEAESASRELGCLVGASLSFARTSRSSQPRSQGSLLPVLGARTWERVCRSTLRSKRFRAV